MGRRSAGSGGLFRALLFGGFEPDFVLAPVDAEIAVAAGGAAFAHEAF
jgi:hypothetical protein